MTNKQENKLTMFNVVLKVLDKNSTLVNTLPALVVAKSNFASAVQTVRKVNLTQQKTTKGKTLDKKQMKVALSDEAYTVAAAVQAYASTIGDNDLFELVHYSRTTLSGMEDEQLPQVCRLILETADGLVANLGDFGVDANQLLEFDHLINDWDSESTVPRMAIAERVAATEELPDLFRKADAVLKNQVDKLMEKFRKTDVMFYNTYKSARKIVNAGHGQYVATITGKMVDTSTMMGIANGTVTDESTETTVTTDANGVFEMPKVPLGETPLAFAASGYLDNVVLVDVQQGMDALEVLMQPLP